MEESYEVSDKNYDINGRFYIEIKGIDFKINMSYDSLLKNIKNNEGRKFRIPASNKANNYIYFDIEDKHDTYNIVAFRNKIKNKFFFYKDDISVKITDKDNKIYEYKIYRDEQLLTLLINHDLLNNYIILNSKAEEIQENEIVKNKSINIKYINYKKEKTEEIFTLYNTLKNLEKESLTLNFDSYFNVKNFSYVETEERKNLEKELEKFILDNEPNILCLTGVSGIGKSITLLHFLKNINGCFRSYFNIRELFKYNEDELLKKEVFKLYDDENNFIKAMEELQNQKYKNIWDKIIFILNNLPKISKKILVFDQYKNKYDQNFTNILYILKNIKNVKIILCASINDNFLRANVIENNWIKKNNKNIIKFHYIEKKLLDLKDQIKDDTELFEFMKAFDYSPKIINQFQAKYNECNEITKKEFIESIFDFYSQNIRNFYRERSLNLYEKYKIILAYIQNEEHLNLNEFSDIIDFLPLKYIKIIKDSDIFVIKYTFPFLYHCFKYVYLENLKMIYKLNILNTNKNSQIGNLIDDLVNINFDVGKYFENRKIEKKIIIDRIHGFKKIFLIINQDNFGNEYKLYFEYYYIKNTIEIEVKSIFLKNEIIFIEQYYQGKDFDGGLFIPFKNLEGNYDLFLYQTSVNKREKFTRNYINEQYKKIKKDFENIFGINIVNGYFSYILFFENPDIETKIFCENNYINFFYYSINKDNLVDSNGKVIKNILTTKTLIYEFKEISEFSDFQMEFNFLKNCLMHNKFDKIKSNESSKNISYLNKKIILSSLNPEKSKEEEKIKLLVEKIKKDVNSLNKYTEINNMFINQIKTENIEVENTNLLSPERKIVLENNIFSEKIEKLKEISIKYNKKLKIEENKYIELKKCLSFYDINIEEKIDLIEKEQSEQQDEKIIQDKKSYNIREKIKRKNLPKNISEIFKGKYTKYSELGNIFFFELDVTKELPFCFLFKNKIEKEYKYLIYLENENITKINLITNKPFNVEDLNNFIENRIKGSLTCNYIKLIE